MNKVIFLGDERLDFEKANPKSNKKYKVRITFPDKSSKIVRFGSLHHQHYRDRIGLYNDLDHNDVHRRKLFHTRFRKLINKSGKYSPIYFSAKFLW